MTTNANKEIQMNNVKYNNKMQFEHTSKLSSFNMISSIPWEINLHEYPILMAVSCLSPVNTCQRNDY